MTLTMTTMCSTF